MKQKIIFNKSTVQFILQALNKTVDGDGYVIDVNSRKHVLDMDGKKFKPKKLKGISKDCWMTKDIHFIRAVK